MHAMNKYPHRLEQGFVDIFLEELDKTESRVLDKILASYKQELDSIEDVEQKESQKIERLSEITLAIMIKRWSAGIDTWAYENTISAIHPKKNVLIKEILSDFSQRNAGLMKEIRAEYVQKVSETLKGIIQQQKADIATGILTKEKAYTEAAEKIRHVTGATKSKAEFWARDQVTKLYSDLSRTRLQQAGAGGYVWSAIMDSRTRPSHAAMHGKFFTWAQVSDIGMLPGEDYLCRCTMTDVSQRPSATRVAAEKKTYKIKVKIAKSKEAVEKAAIRIKRTTKYKTVSDREKKIRIKVLKKRMIKELKQKKDLMRKLNG